MKIHPISILLAGETVELWPQRVLAWPAEATLFLADAHFGKAATFRAAGIPAPDGTEDDLRRLDEVLAASQARRVGLSG